MAAATMTDQTSLPTPAEKLARRQSALRLLFGAAGAAGTVLALLGWWTNPAEFYHVYLFAAVACLNPALGCLVLTFIHRMTGGAWGRTLAPALTAGQRMVPWALLFCVPLFFGLPHLFPWAVAPETLGEQTRTLLARHPVYFGRAFFLTRTVVCVALLLGVLAVARRGARAAWTGPVGLIVYVVAVYVLAVDWVLSLEPGWYSTGFTVIVMASQTLSALALCVAASVLASPPVPRNVVNKGITAAWKDLGNLLLGCIMFWAYVAYSQFLIVWSGNLPAQAAWYLHRNAGGWHHVLIGVVALHLFLPVLMLLSNRVKRRAPVFAALATFVILVQAVYLYWLILPTFRPAGIGFHWLDAAVPLALDGLWLFLYLGNPLAVSPGAEAQVVEEAGGSTDV